MTEQLLQCTQYTMQVTVSFVRNDKTGAQNQLKQRFKKCEIQVSLHMCSVISQLLTTNQTTNQSTNQTSEIIC